MTTKGLFHWTGLIDYYSQYLDIQLDTVISLNEGNTPLVRAYAIEDHLKIKDLTVYLKVEGANPTGSFKDRGMTAAMTDAIAKGYRKMICASTGNTSASAAAYTAYARSRGYTDAECIVLIPDGYVALGKLAQAIAYGAKIIQIEGNFDRALELVRELTEQHKDTCTLVNSVNPARIEGQKTASFEIIDQLGMSPDILALPVGNAGNITAYWRGFQRYCPDMDLPLPKMFGFQAAGSAPIVFGHPVIEPQTIATAIRIGNPASWSSALEARDKSDGLIDMVSDEEIIEAYKLIHQGQGIMCEPASAASVAGIIKKKELLKEGQTIVCVLTGNGLKDPQTMIDVHDFQPTKTKADLGAISEIVLA